MWFIIFIFICTTQGTPCHQCNKVCTYPPLDKSLTWFPIGFKYNFYPEGGKASKVTIRDKNYVVWTDKKEWYALHDSCSHQGSSFVGTRRNVERNQISCPYHGYVFDGTNGTLVKIPHYPHVESVNQHIESFPIMERGDVLYINIQQKNITTKEFPGVPWVEPEFSDPLQRVTTLEQTFSHQGKIVTVNSLDICHIGFVHSFGNKKHPNPLKVSKIKRLHEGGAHHYKIVYEYLAGENSLVNKIYNIHNITVENEYILPHSTVARVKFGQYTSTIITHALPVRPFETKLFVKAYRSYWVYPPKKVDFLGLKLTIQNPFQHLGNFFGDAITKYTMTHTLREDKAIIDYIDRTPEQYNGKFSIIYDLLSNHYKRAYNQFYEQ